MLKTNQMTDLDSAKMDIQNKQTILKAAIDTQVVLRILVDKGIVSKDEVNQYRSEVQQSPKYKNAAIYIEQTLKEIELYEKNPDLMLREMLKRKAQGRKE